MRTALNSAWTRSDGVWGESAGGWFRTRRASVWQRHSPAAGVVNTLVPVEGADHIFDGHADVDGLVRLSVEYLTETLCP